MFDSPDHTSERYTTTPWDRDGIAALEATATDARSALELGLRAVLTLAVEPVLATDGATGSAPIQGEGDDLADLFADMAEDLLAQIADFGSGLHDVAVDGVLSREGGGYVGWGYASGTLEAASPGEVPRLLSVPTVVENGTQVAIRAQLHRQ